MSSRLTVPLPEECCTVNVRYIAIYKLHGANKLPEEAASAKLLASQSPAVTAILTDAPEPYFIHINKSAALGAQLLQGLFAPDQKGTWQERLAATVEEVKARRTEKTGTGVFLVFDGETDIPTPEFGLRRDTDDFAISFDAIAKSEIRESFRPFVQSVMTALGLSFSEGADRRIEILGDVVFLIDPSDGKPIYDFSAQFGEVRLSVASPLTGQVISEAAVLAPKLVTLKDMARPTSLLITSFEVTTDNLQAFIAAWSALEICVNTTFKSTYEARWFGIMKEGAPTSAGPVFDRLRKH